MGTRALEQSWQQVRRLAEQHADDWEGQDLVGDAPLRIFAGARVPRRVLVVTKEAVLKRWRKSDWPSGLVLVVASGIVTRPQAAILEKLASDTSAPIAFVGDADPMGLHTYVSLRGHLGAQRVRFTGICDAVLDTIGDDDVQLDRLQTLEFTALDRAHLRVVEGVAKPERVLGPHVSAVLRNGRKIEIEALSVRAGLTPALFKAALKVAGQRGR
jgi:DNA topoisomerase VI subunit A